MNKSINQLVGEITSLAVVITTNTDIDVFTNYVAHCNNVEISIHKDGWVNNHTPDVFETVHMEQNSYKTEKDIIKKLEEVEKQLIRIARKDKINFSKLPYELIQVKKYHLVGGRKNA